jgi:chromosome segregation ATPase
MENTKKIKIEDDTKNLKDEVDILKKAILKLIDKTKSLENDKVEMKTDINDLIDALKYEEKNKVEMKTHISNSIDEIKSLEKDKVEMKIHINNLIDKTKSLENDKVEMKTHINNLIDKTKSLENEKVEMKIRIDILYEKHYRIARTIFDNYNIHQDMIEKLSQTIDKDCDSISDIIYHSVGSFEQFKKTTFIKYCCICRNKIDLYCIECEKLNLISTCLIQKLKCGHSFHYHCFQRWLSQRYMCPLDNSFPETESFYKRS